jgi:hypothetical protein
LIQQHIGLLGGHHARQGLGDLGGAQQSGHIDLDEALALEEAEETSQRGQLAPRGDGAETAPV